MKEEKQYLDKKNILDIYVVELAFMVVFGLMYVFYKNFRFI
jgi:hypothetical protein